jgi:hypothetical protein
MIREAVAITRGKYGDSPSFGMVSFVDRDEVKPTMRHGKPIWGWCFMKAGFKQVHDTKGGLAAFQLLPQDMPEPIRIQEILFALTPLGRKRTP